MSKRVKTEASLVRVEHEDDKPVKIITEVTYDGSASFSRSVRPAIWKIVKKHGIEGTWSGPHVVTQAQVTPGPIGIGTEFHLVSEFRRVR